MNPVTFSGDESDDFPATQPIPRTQPVYNPINEDNEFLKKYKAVRAMERHEKEYRKLVDLVPELQQAIKERDAIIIELQQIIAEHGIELEYDDE